MSRLRCRSGHYSESTAPVSHGAINQRLHNIAHGDRSVAGIGFDRLSQRHSPWKIFLLRLMQIPAYSTRSIAWNRPSLLPQNR